MMPGLNTVLWFVALAGIAAAQDRKAWVEVGSVTRKPSSLPDHPLRVLVNAAGSIRFDLGEGRDVSPETLDRSIGWSAADMARLATELEKAPAWGANVLKEHTETERQFFDASLRDRLTGAGIAAKFYSFLLPRANEFHVGVSIAFQNYEYGSLTEGALPTESGRWGANLSPEAAASLAALLRKAASMTAKAAAKDADQAEQERRIFGDSRPAAPALVAEQTYVVESEVAMFETLKETGVTRRLLRGAKVTVLLVTERGGKRYAHVEAVDASGVASGGWIREADAVHLRRS